jgi:DNA-binding transcriptional ArsR family regulator
MAKLSFHPNAYLSKKRNVRRGLESRTKILRALEKESATASMLTEKSKLSYFVVLHHLRLLGDEKIITGDRSKKPYIWKLTGMGQQRLKTS